MKSPFISILKLIVMTFSFVVMFISCNKNDDSISTSDNKDIDSHKIYGTFTDPRDQHVYKTIKIGNQIWMAENLAYLPNVVSEKKVSPTVAYCYVYGYNGTNAATAMTLGNYATYGVLYNWVAAQTACPKGWHLPNDEEWNTLVNYLIISGYNFDGTKIQNKVGKALSATSWRNHSDVTGSIGNSLAANNSSGFSALPGGKVDDIGFCNDAGVYGFWWSATANNAGIYSASYRFMYSNSVGIGQDFERKDSGFSVRCIKD